MLTYRQRGGLVLAFGLLGVLTAQLPCLDLRPPALVPVDPGQAAAAELLSLPGVGPARARAILAYRRRRAAGAAVLGRDPLASSWARAIAPFLSRRARTAGSAPAPGAER
jgi:hypothetical protein